MTRYRTTENIYRSLFLLFFLFLAPGSANSQADHALVEYVDFYAQKIRFQKFECGHVLDGPNFFLNQMENRSIDHWVTISEKQQDSIGKISHRNVLEKYKLVPSKSVNDSIRKVFSNIMDHAPSQGPAINLYVLKSDEINAFTMIGGRIYITTGLLQFVQSDDELAFIISHEIGHQVHRHLERKIGKILLISNLTGFAKNEAFTKMALEINSKFTAPFGQANEYESDKYGFGLARSAGYDENKFSDFFIRLEKSENTSIFSKLNATHPFSKDRRACLHQYISN